MRSSKTLLKRIEELKSHGFDLLSTKATLTEMSGLIGDLTLPEFQKMLSLAGVHQTVAEIVTEPKRGASGREFDRLRTQERQDDIRSRKNKKLD